VSALLKLSRAIDWLNNQIGRLAIWLILASVLISAGNAIMRKAFNISSNAYLEVQWYLYATVFMLAAANVFLHNGHVRIDFIAARLSKRANAIIDALGIVIFLIPLCLILIDLSWPYFMRTYLSGEVSENAGGLIRWPVVFLIPAGFFLLLMQGVSELIKRVAFLVGAIDEPFTYGHEKSAEEELVEELAAKPGHDELRGDRK
jgi:TRAP-type mannitol/chloroaromatic compound transport system permease small subunit